MLGYLEYLNLPAKVGIVIIAMLFVMQIIGELLEFKGKVVVPEFMKIRKFFKRKKEERTTL